MPEPRGRKRRHRERHRERGPSVPAASRPRADDAAPQRAITVEPRMPSRSARATGLMIAVVTAFLAVLMVKENFGSGTESLVRVAAGALLVALAAVVGVLSVFPERVRRIVRRE